MNSQSKKSKDDFYKALADKESSNNPKAKNFLGFIGLYQMGELALDDAGYYNSKDGTWGKNDWKGEWTAKDGIKNTDDFLNNPNIQHKAIQEYHKILWEKYLKDYHSYEGKTINGAVLTKSGMIAASHLIGHGEFKKFLKSNGQYIPEDGNKVKCTTYLEIFSNYYLSINSDEIKSNKEFDTDSLAACLYKAMSDCPGIRDYTQLFVKLGEKHIKFEKEDYRDAYFSHVYKKMGMLGAVCHELNANLPQKIISKLCNGEENMPTPIEYCSLSLDNSQEHTNFKQNMKEFAIFQKKATTGTLSQEELDRAIQSKEENYAIFFDNFSRIQTMLTKFYLGEKYDQCLVGQNDMGHADEL